MSSCSDSDEEATMEEVAVTTTFPFVESPEVFMSNRGHYVPMGLRQAKKKKKKKRSVWSRRRLNFH